MFWVTSPFEQEWFIPLLHRARLSHVVLRLILSVKTGLWLPGLVCFALFTFSDRQVTEIEKSDGEVAFAIFTSLLHSFVGEPNSFWFNYISFLKKVKLLGCLCWALFNLIFHVEHGIKMGQHHWIALI